MSLKRKMEDLGSNGNSLREEKLIKHYRSSHRILLVGEGDFSFAACLANAFGSAQNIIATSLDTRERVIIMYIRAKAQLEKLEKLGCTLLHGVDVHTMSRHTHLKYEKFDRIIFNFPHVGLDKYSYEDDEHQISANKKLVCGFFWNACKMMNRSGEVHVTHKTTHPFDRWEIKKLAEAVGLKLIEAAQFWRFDYPGYENKRGQHIPSGGMQHIQV